MAKQASIITSWTTDDEFKSFYVFSEEILLSLREEAGEVEDKAAIPPVLPYPESGYVYLVRQGESGYFKVGRTTDPISRRRNLQTGNPQKLHMKVRKVFDMHEAEQKLLEIMDKKNDEKKKGGREWFHVSPSDAKNVYETFMKISLKWKME